MKIWFDPLIFIARTAILAMIHDKTRIGSTDSVVLLKEVITKVQSSMNVVTRNRKT